MKAVILAGGKESLFNPLSKFSVKALLPVGNRPALSYLLRTLKDNGIDDVLISCGASAEPMRREFSDGGAFGVRIQYFEDDFTRGPGGCLKPMRDQIGNHTFVVISPVYTGKMSFQALLERHREEACVATVAVAPPKEMDADSCFVVNATHHIVACVDHPLSAARSREGVLCLPVGIYVFEPRIFDSIPGERYLDIKEQLIPSLLSANKPVRACFVEGEVNRLGNVVEYFKANQAVFDNVNGCETVGKEIAPRVYTGDHVSIAPDVLLEGPLIIGSNAVVESGARLVGPAVIGDGCRIARGCVVQESILWSGTQVGEGAVVQNSISCRDTRIRAGTTLKNSLINGRRLLLGELALAESYFAPLRLNGHKKGRSQFLTLMNGGVKRAMDIAGAVFGLVIFAAPLLLLALLIKLDSKGPIFFTQIRRGKGGRKFAMIKFRSMVVGADEMVEELRACNQSDGPMFKIRHDPRLTRVGRFLRRTSLDELPQLINVLRGEMSLVGPRPLAMKEMRWSPRWRDIRLRVKPGITGLWQIKGRSNSQFHDWIEHDIHYVQNQSIWLDCKIILATLKSVLKRTGAY